MEWDNRHPDTAYTRAHDPLFRAREVKLVAMDATAQAGLMPASVSLVVLRVWR